MGFPNIPGAALVQVSPVHNLRPYADDKLTLEHMQWLSNVFPDLLAFPKHTRRGPGPSSALCRIQTDLRHHAAALKHIPRFTLVSQTYQARHCPSSALCRRRADFRPLASALRRSPRFMCFSQTYQARHWSKVSPLQSLN